MCALFFYTLCSVISCFHVAPPIYCISCKRERKRYCGAGSTSKRCVYATFQPNGSDKRQKSGRIKAVGRWFESGRCVGGGFKRKIAMARN